MNKLREKFHLPKAHSLYESESHSSLETMVRDSIYLAWPMANVKSERADKCRGYLSKHAAFDEDDEDDSG